MQNLLTVTSNLAVVHRGIICNYQNQKLPQIERDRFCVTSVVVSEFKEVEEVKVVTFQRYLQAAKINKDFYIYI